MSQSVDGKNKTLIAAADYSAKQYHIMKVVTAGTATIASAATDFLVGVLQNEPKANEGAEVSLISGGGTCKVIAGGSISVGDALTADSNGQAVATTTTGNYLIGRALEAADAGDIIEVLLGGHNRYAATS